MVPVVCVGELEADRAAGRHEDVVVAPAARLARRAVAGPGRRDWSSPTSRSGRSAPAARPRRTTPRRCRALTRARCCASSSATPATAVRVLYGGSVKPGNAAELFAQADIDGGLVGGASLDRASYLAIARAARADG